MKTRTLLIIAIIALCIPVYAGFVTCQTAKKVALNFYYEKYNQYEGVIEYQSLQIESTYTSKQSNENFYYVFHFKNGGFVIVPSDDCLSPVMGYSFQNNFVADNQPSHVKWWFGQIEEQVRYVRQNKLLPENKTADQWTYYLNDGFVLNTHPKASKAVEPLLTTLWDQGWPYNYYCPVTTGGGSGGHTWAGCVATACAQIAYYWRWPDHGQGYTSYIPLSHPEYGMQSANFENTFYCYDQMCDQPQTVNLAIAEYTYHIAVGLHMNFNPGGSAPTLGDSISYFFKYMEGEWYYRDNMPEEQWKAMLMNALDQKLPVYYAGNPSSGAGHAFVCDGYQDEDYYHFNFGWGGSSNGYYTIDNVQGFNYDQEIVPNFVPDTLQFTYPQYCSGHDTCCIFEGSICDGSGPIYDYQNNTQASWLIDPQTEYDSVTNITIMVKRLDLFNDGDKLSIYDGGDNTAPLLAELTGNVIPADIVSTSNKVFLEFITDGANTAPGFYLNYKTTQPEWCSGMTTYSDPAATISDGSGPFYYYNTTTCTWIIDPGQNEPLTLYFNYFDTEQASDKLKIYDAIANELVAEISGYYENPPEPVTVESGKVMLAFLSNSSVRADGWELWYDIDYVKISENSNKFNFSMHPNPVNSDFQIKFNLQTEKQVSIHVYNLMGKELNILIDDNLGQGYHSVQGDLGLLPEGLYFIKFKAGDETVSKKIIKL
jgi:hypothetical protein